MANEDIINYYTRVKRMIVATKFDDLTAEQSRVLFTILTSGDAKFIDHCMENSLKILKV